MQWLASNWRSVQLGSKNWPANKAVSARATELCKSDCINKFKCESSIKPVQSVDSVLVFQYKSLGVCRHYLPEIQHARGLQQFEDGRMIWYPPVHQTVEIPDEDKLWCAEMFSNKSNDFDLNMTWCHFLLITWKINCYTETKRANSLVPAHGYYVIDQSTDLVDSDNMPENYPDSIPTFVVVRNTKSINFVEIMKKQSNICLLVEQSGEVGSYLERLFNLQREADFEQLPKIEPLNR